MSNGNAISTVTHALQKLIQSNVGELSSQNSVTTLPPDQVKAGDANQLNLFLYHLSPDAAWRNMDMPRTVRPGEIAPPPLPLVLDYLITAYGKDDHIVLGKTMRVLHDHPLFSPDELGGDSELDRQVERVRLTLQPLSLEDMYRLWNGFQTQYRVSAAYQVSVVLIESARATRSSLPVLRRGAADDGVKAVTGGAPSLSGLVFPDSQPGIRLGETLVLQGSNLSVANTKVRFTHLLLPAPIELDPSAGDKDGELKVSLPETPADMSAWAPGVYMVSLAVRPAGLPSWTSNELPLSLAPRITRAPKKVAAGDTLTVTCEPRVIPDRQRVALVMSGQQIAPDSIDNPADTTKPSSIKFVVPALDPGSYAIRLRVDGIDSIPVIKETKPGQPPLPIFDPDQTVDV